MKLTYTIQPNDNFFNVKELLKLKFQISDRLLVICRFEVKAF